MNLQTTRLLLTEITEGDIADIHEMNSFEAVARHNTIGIPNDIAQTKKQLQRIIEDRANAKRTRYGWAIRMRKTNEFVGEIGMTLAAERFKMGEIYYSLHPEKWKQGYATEAVQAVLASAFDTLKMHRIEAGVDTENTNSIRLLERVGMQREGCRRKILPINGMWKDSYLYAILETN